MRKRCALMLAFIITVGMCEVGQAAEDAESAAWIGKYPVSFFTKARSSKVVEKGRLLLSLKNLYNNFDEIKTSSGDYDDLPSGDKNEKLTTVLVAKYGWKDGHHFAVGIPYIWNDFEIGGTDVDTDGLGNIYFFEKWNFIKESKRAPGVAIDLWHYLPSGDSRKKLGSSKYSWKVAGEVSKAWKHFSLHVNPSYRFGSSDTPYIVEANSAILFTPWKKLWPAVEYNYFYKEESGLRHDIVPGVIWKFAPGCSLKVAPIINLHSNMKFRDEAGVVLKISRYF